MNLTELTLEQLKENFDDCFNWEDKYRYILELGRKLPSLADDEMTDDNKVVGCQSNAWLVAETTEDSPSRLSFRAGSDSQIVNGLMAVVIVACSGKTAAEILEFDIEALFDELELKRHLSPIRGNGLLAMVKKIREIATQQASA